MHFGVCPHNAVSVVTVKSELSLLDATDAEALSSLSIENQQFSMQVFHAL
jgi:hypothetical protein